MAAGPGEYAQPETVAVLGVHDQELLHEGLAGAYGTPERVAVLDRLEALLEGCRVTHETDRRSAGTRPCSSRSLASSSAASATLSTRG
ncbi:hypothetical protein [Streptomyces sp. NPDC088719]|uniref:hypothetical protein n=1 Tax=Streptomyces sp. NPDC088719 TaxID=3365872 RepID=UPI0037FAD225